MGSENSHQSDCGEVLDEVYLYLDLECDEQRRDLIRTHLDECSPCLREFGIEQEVKLLVSRCCGGEKAPGPTSNSASQRAAAASITVSRP